MAGMNNRDEVVRELLRVDVEPSAWLDEFLANNEKGQPDPFVFLPSPQGLVPVLSWIDTMFGQPFADVDVAPEAWNSYVAQQENPDELRYAIDVQRLHEQGDDQMSMYDRMQYGDLKEAYEVANRARESFGIAPAVLYQQNEQAVKGGKDHGGNN